MHDGLAAATAASSCWEVKQITPSAPDGVYWLQTPALVAPAQFYCDQTTDGGGWVLIGRGRENWSFLYTGQGTASAIATTPSGTGAFTPAALPSTTVDGLLNGGRVDALSDGVRLKRAKSTDGVTTQEVRFKFSSRDRWTWTIPAYHPLGTWSMTGTGFFGTSTTTGSGGNSNSFGTDNSFARVGTLGTSSENYRSGFAFGSSPSGSTSATSYVWKNSASGARAVPFTQVFLRPRLMSADVAYPAIGDSGAPAQALRAMPETTVLDNPWGVTGLASGINSVDTTEVRTIAQVGNRMIVGGNFAAVQRDEAGTGRTPQAYVAAFDAASGEWLSDFRPTLDGQVERLIGLPNGDIVVAGNFTTVNGQPAPGIVALNPSTGAIDPAWRVTLEQRQADQPLYVRGLAIGGGYLYLGGNFTHLSGGSVTTASYSRSLARVALADGRPDTNWRPEVLGNINAIAAGQDGTRVYVVGKYTTIQDATNAPYFTALSTAPGAALIPGQNPQFSNTNSRYQQAVVEAGSRVWEGGAEHMLYSYNTSDMSLASTNIAYNKGDIQVATASTGTVFASCHCAQWLYSGARTWPSPSGWSQADSLEFVGAWDASTGNYLPTFVPEGIESREEYGAWAITFDTSGTMWVGGDFVSARGASGTRTWTGAFLRFPAADATPPSVPTGLRYVVRSPSVLRLTWTLSTDNDPRPIRYEVLAGDRVIATVGGNVADLVMPTAATRYFVRAIDKEGNRSATTPVLTYTP